MLVAEEVPLQGKQICCSFAVVDVNDFLALCVDVEQRDGAENGCPVGGHEALCLIV